MNQDRHGRLLSKMRLSDVFSQVQKHNIQYAVILGNHDTSTFVPRRDFLDWIILSGDSLSLTKAGPKNITGASNYFLPIESFNSSQEAARLWFFDSMRNACEGNEYSWGCVGPDTVAWFDSEASHVTIPGAAFIHIPLPEFLDAWRNSSSDAKGGKYETVGCPRENTHLFNMFRKHQVTSVYSGHDHLNDFIATHKGVRLAYGKTTGYGGYPPHGLKGSRIINLKEGQPTGDADTYLRLEDGTRTNQLGRESSLSAWQWNCAAGPRADPSLSSAQRKRSALIVNALVILFALFLGCFLYKHFVRAKYVPMHRRD